MVETYIDRENRERQGSESGVTNGPKGILI